VINRDIDLAIVFDGPERRSRHTDLKIKPIDHPFDVVCISSDEDFIRRVDAALLPIPVGQRDRRIAAIKPILRERRAVKLSSNSQPHAELLGSNSRERCIEVDTFDAAIALVAAKVADFSIVPAFYPRFERAWAHGELFFSCPVSQLQILAVFRHDMPMQSAAADLLDRLDDQLQTATRCNAEAIQWQAIPASIQAKELGKLKFAYYIDGVRRRDDSGGLQRCPPFEWRWQKIVWKGRKDTSFTGEIRNCERDEFKFTARADGGAFIVEANELGRNKNSIPRFVSVFSRATNSPLRFLGVWTSAEPHSSSLYATVWSEDKLELSDLHRIQQTAFRYVLSSEKGVRFDEQ
jgi:hypothetical protein